MSSSLTKRELELAAEYEALGDDPERRDAIRRELYNLRWKLDNESARKFHTTGKGRRDTTMCEGCVGARPARTRRFLKAKKLPDDILPKELAHTLPTLRAIFRNCSDRSRSIRELAAERNCSPAAARRKYFADRKKLLNYFLMRIRPWAKGSREKRLWTQLSCQRS